MIKPRFSIKKQILAKAKLVMLLNLLYSHGVLAATSEWLASDAGVKTDGREQILLAAIDDIAVGNIIQAQVALQRLIKKQPDFGLAQLIYADLLYSQAGQLGAVGGGIKPRGRLIKAKMVGYRQEVKRRVQHAQKRDADQQFTALDWPAGLIKLADNQSHVIIVDGSVSRLQLWQKKADKLALKADFYSSVARNGLQKQVEGDKRTPVGVYYTTARLDKKGLGYLYGSGAMPLNYPNAWDRLQGRSGYGIWLHGVPSRAYNREPLATNGCVALPNSNFTYLADSLNSQPTTVLIVDGLQRISQKQRLQQAKQFSQLFDAWQAAWQGQQVDQIKTYYSADFRSGKETYQRWLKKLPKRAKSYQPQTRQQLSIFAYPGEQGLVMMTFEQLDNKLTKTTGKNKKGQVSQIRQYWQQSQAGDWQIIYEKAIKLLPVHLRGIPAGVKRIARINS